ncbi:hypothetical protein AB0F52_47610 [Amycolatopsis sp. NPDC024027]|uniref:hypothetical protein n=1 Tax=Amycolatopsis sp. NPDC024027 TaxID=3154327 RepID=UPI0033F20589
MVNDGVQDRLPAGHVVHAGSNELFGLGRVDRANLDARRVVCPNLDVPQRLVLPAAAGQYQWRCLAPALVDVEGLDGAGGARGVAGSFVGVHLVQPVDDWQNQAGVDQHFGRRARQDIGLAAALVSARQSVRALRSTPMGVAFPC